jgi:hypothetical protein
MNKKFSHLVGKRVLVDVGRGIMATGKLLELLPKYGNRDVLIQLPMQKKPRRFWASKISEIK